MPRGTSLTVTTGGAEGVWKVGTTVILTSGVWIVWGDIASLTGSWSQRRLAEGTWVYHTNSSVTLHGYGGTRRIIAHQLPPANYPLFD